METSVEVIEGNKVRLRVSVPAGDFEKAVDAAFRKIAREVRIPGFRPGKAPRRILEAHLGGPELAREQALRDALPGYYTDAVEAEALDPIAAPEIDITAGQEDGDVSFDAVVEVRPTASITGYAGLEVTLPDPAVAEADVDAQVDQLRERFADLEDSLAPLAKGDYAQLNIKGYVHNEEVEGLSASDFLYEVGSEIVVPKLDTELEGRRPGDIVRFNDILPERWGERAGQEVAFQVLVKETKRKVLPEANDDWAREASEFETLDELRADIHNRMEAVNRIQAQLALRDRLLDAVAGLVHMDVPESLISEEMERRLHSMVHRLESQGATVEQYLQATGTTQEDLVAQVRMDAIQAVKADLGLRAVAAAEELEVTDEEVGAEIDRLARTSSQKPAQLRKEIERGRGLEAVRSELVRGKALQFLVDHAVVVDEAGKPLDLSPPEQFEKESEA
jgi:trigger factor